MTEQELQNKAKDLAKNVPLRTDTPYPEMVRYFFASMYLRGYDDGKNDTTEWHYLSKGELPPNDGDYLVCIEYEDREYIRVSQYFGETGWYTDLGEVYGDWTPIAWQYFVPPKEEAHV